MIAWLWLVRIVALASLVAFAGVILVDTLNGWPLGPWQVMVVAVNTTVGSVYLCVGWLLVERRPRNPIGPLLLGVGVIYALVGPFDLYLSLGRDQPWSRYAVLVAMTSGAPIGLFRSTALILFPDGRPPNRRWWAIIAIGIVGASLSVAAQMFRSSTFAPVYPELVSPFAIPGFPRGALESVADSISTAMLVAAAIALMIRWRRGSPTERAQTTWVLAAGIVMVVTDLAARLTSDTYDLVSALLGIVQNLGLALIPIAMAIAILRYHLYEIDRIVSRTIGYAVVTAVLFGVFFVVNLGLQRVLGDLVGSAPVVVAGSTLVVAALFQPLRIRVQRAVDRRFHRARYDAERTVAGFAGRLRDQLDLPTLTVELRRATVEAVEPATTAVWLRVSSGSR